MNPQNQNRDFEDGKRNGSEQSRPGRHKPLEDNWAMIVDIILLVSNAISISSQWSLQKD